MNKKNFCRRIVIDIPMMADISAPNAGIRITVDGPPEQMELPIDTPAPAGCLADSAEKFITDWLAGNLAIRAQPVCSVDLFTLYERACPASATDQRSFVRVLRRHGVRVSAGRFMQGKRLLQARVLIPPGSVRPRGLTRTAWLTQCIAGFNSYLESLK